MNSGRIDQSAGGTFQGTNGWIFVGQDGGSGTYNLSGGQANKARLYVGRSGGTGTLTMTGSGVVNNEFTILGTDSGSTSTTTLSDNAVILNSGSTELHRGTLTLSDHAVIQAQGEVWAGNGAGANGQLSLSGFSVAEAGTWIAIGRDSAVGVASVSDHAVLQKVDTGTATSAQSYITIGGLGAGNGGTLTVSGNALVQSSTNMVLSETQGRYGIVIQSGGIVTLHDNPAHANFNQALEVDASGSGLGQYHLLGGELEVESVDVGSGIMNLNGGLLRGLKNADPFITGGPVTVGSSGGQLDTGGFALTVASAFVGSGNLDKLGSGTLVLSGTNAHTGILTAAEGIIRTTHDAALDDLATVNVKVSAGAGLLLDFFGADAVDALQFDGVPQPAGLHDASSDPGVIGGTGALLVGDEFEIWIAGFYPGETDPMIVGRDADPDRDGHTSKVEFALGGLPDDGADGPKVFVFAADSNLDPDSDPELILTIAVRAGTPAFVPTGGGTPIANKDGCRYAISGSRDLLAFAGPVSVVSPPIVAGLPPAPVGYEYRSFSLEGSNGMPFRGFLRVMITP